MMFRARRRQHVHRRRLAGLVLALVAALAVSCSSEPASDAGPDQQIAAFISSWQQLHPDEASDLTSDPAAAAIMLDEVTGNLHPDSLTITAGDINRTGQNSATTIATFTWTLPDAGTWSYPVTWTWQRSSASADWLLDWSPTVVHPKLGERQTLAIRTSDPQPGVLVDRNNVQIASPVRVYSVVLLPGTVPDVAATAAVLAPILAPLDPTITADSIVAGAAAAVAAAPAAPDDQTGAAPTAGSAAAGESARPVDPATIGYTIINLRETDYQQVKAQLDAVPGLSFPSDVRNLPPTRDFARALLAQVTPVVADRIRGEHGWKVIVVDTTGGTLEILEDHPAIDGERVTLTLDSKTQQAAEAALADIAQPAVLLAMQPSTGELLTVAQNTAANAQGTLALTGQYPPGSTFKVVTATAGLDRGLIVPGQPVPCPGAFSIDGREIHNAHDFDLGTVDSTVAFAKSCNTTFAKLATQMPGDALPTAATDYGIGLDFVMDGATTLTGKVPTAATPIQRAENGFGQGEVLITPFSAVVMAATAQHGAMPMPVLIRGTTTTVDRPAPTRTAAVQQAIQSYMKAVVDQGTGQGLERFGDVHAKTGTAEYAAEDGSTHAHAWTVGYVGDMAFAALVVGGEDSVVTNQVITEFLSTR